MTGSQPRDSDRGLTNNKSQLWEFFEAQIAVVFMFTMLNALAPPRLPWWSLGLSWALVALGALLYLVNAWASVAVEAAAIVFVLANLGLYMVRRRRWRRRQDAIFGGTTAPVFADAVRRLQGRD